MNLSNLVLLVDRKLERSSIRDAQQSVSLPSNIARTVLFTVCVTSVTQNCQL